MLPSGDQLVEVLKTEADVLAYPGTPDLTAPHCLSDPPCRDVQIRRGLVRLGSVVAIGPQLALEILDDGEAESNDCDMLIVVTTRPTGYADAL